MPICHFCGKTTTGTYQVCYTCHSKGLTVRSPDDFNAAKALHDRFVYQSAIPYLSGIGFYNLSYCGFHGIATYAEFTKLPFAERNGSDLVACSGIMTGLTIEVKSKPFITVRAFNIAGPDQLYCWADNGCMHLMPKRLIHTIYLTSNGSGSGEDLYLMK